MPRGKTVAGNETRLKILRYIARFNDVNRYTPTYRDIMAGADVSSTSVVKYHVEIMGDEGLIDFKKNTRRTLTLTKKGYEFLNKEGYEFLGSA